MLLKTVLAVMLAMLAMESGAQDMSIVDPEERLFKYLTNSSTYEPKIRPGVLKDGKKMPLTVNTIFSPYRIIELDGRLETMSILVYITEIWGDRRLTWDPKDFGNISSVTVKAESIWTPRSYWPNILLLNREDKAEALGAKISIGGHFGFPQANVRLITYTILQERCDFSMYYFPFDRQACDICLASSQYERADLMYNAIFERAISFIPGGEWDLEIGFARNRSDDSTSLPCMVLVVRRKYLYYIINLFIPTICICLLNTIGLFASIDADQNELDFADMGQTTLLSLGVMLLTVAEQTPKGASEVSLLSTFFLTMILQTLLAAMTAMYMRKWAKNHGGHRIVPTSVSAVTKEFASRFVDPTKRWIRFCMVLHVSLIVLITTTVIAVGMVNSNLMKIETLEDLEDYEHGN